jgi:hypothetical protein
LRRSRRRRRSSAGRRFSTHRSGLAKFTSAAFTTALAESGVAISMDGRGRSTVFIERL